MGWWHSQLNGQIIHSCSRWYTYPSEKWWSSWNGMMTFNECTKIIHSCASHHQPAGTFLWVFPSYSTPINSAMFNAELQPSSSTCLQPRPAKVFPPAAWCPFPCPKGYRPRRRPQTSPRFGLQLPIFWGLMFNHVWPCLTMFNHIPLWNIMKQPPETWFFIGYRSCETLEGLWYIRLLGLDNLSKHRKIELSWANMRSKPRYSVDLNGLKQEEDSVKKNLDFYTMLHCCENQPTTKWH